MQADNESMFRILHAIFKRDLRVYFRTRGAWLNPLIFVLLVITLFTLGIGPDAKQLASNATAIIWVVALLGIMLSLDALFRSDYEDGTLEQLLLSPRPLYFAIMGKVAAHWLVTGLPMLLASPLFALMLGIPISIVPLLALGLFFGQWYFEFCRSNWRCSYSELTNRWLVNCVNYSSALRTGYYFWRRVTAIRARRLVSGGAVNDVIGLTLCGSGAGPTGYWRRLKN